MTGLFLDSGVRRNDDGKGILLLFAASERWKMISGDDAKQWCAFSSAPKEERKKPAEGRTQI
jgi:hypothetical protein